MGKLLSFLALVAGVCLLYLGYVRQSSVAGQVDASFSHLGQRMDGAAHTPVHVRYYAAGAVLVVVGAFGLGIIKK